MTDLKIGAWGAEDQAVNIDAFPLGSNRDINYLLVLKLGIKQG